MVLAGKESEAIPGYENQLKILKRLIEKGPATSRCAVISPGTYQSIGNAYRLGGNVDRAVENLRRSAELLLQLRTGRSAVCRRPSDGGDDVLYARATPNGCSAGLTWRSPIPNRRTSVFAG